MRRYWNIWNFKAVFYHRIRLLPVVRLLFNKEMKNLHSLILKIADPYTRVLDVATGTGSTLSLIPQTCSVFGMDRSLNMLQKAARHRSMIPINSDATFLPFKDHTFPVILAIGLTEYLADKTFFFQEIVRVLDPTGYFLVTISPPNLLNAIRNLLGSRIYPIRIDQWENAIGTKGFSVIDRKKSLIQIQYLLYFPQKKKIPNVPKQYEVVT